MLGKIWESPNYNHKAYEKLYAIKYCAWSKCNWWKGTLQSYQKQYQVIKTVGIHQKHSETLLMPVVCFMPFIISLDIG